MRLFALISLIMTGAVVSAQNVTGNWECAMYQMKLVLNQNGTYSISHSAGSSSGRYQFNGQQLWMQDQNGAPAVTYSVSFSDTNSMMLTDVNQNQLSFARAGASSSPAQTPVPSGNVQSFMGDWSSPQTGIKLSLRANGTYSMVHSAGTSNGNFQIRGNEIWMQDQNGSAPVGYYIAMNNAALTLTDGNGTPMSFTRAGGTGFQPAPSSSPAPMAQNGPVQGQVLSSKNGLQLKQGHVDIGIGLTEFILGYAVTPAERKELQDRLIVEFGMNPQEALRQLNDIGNALNKLHTLTDPAQIGQGRQALFAALYLGTMQMQENQKPLIVQVLNRHIKALAIDQKNQLVLTDRDALGICNYLAFFSTLQGSPVDVTPDYFQSFSSDLVSRFPSFPLEQKQLMCSGSLLWTMIESNWKKMTPDQQRQFQASVLQQMPAQQGYAQNDSWKNSSGYSNNTGSRKKSIAEMQADFNAKQNMFQMMQNMNTQTNATTLNIIENIGGTGNYWEVTDVPQY